MWREKNAGAIRGIQDALACCGFRTTVDQAWPFPRRGRGPGACVDMFHRQGSCMGPLMARERFVLGVWIGIGVCGLFAQVSMLTKSVVFFWFW